ncbi:ATP-binding protein [Streptomyces finlayi]|uniref:ATP-binding protein n=1 Tax=Streptomyces finlayi TaxID=67296 RepID=UPI001E630FAE|nr:ATP-binding protein [Streptomyces finlayi]
MNDTGEIGGARDTARDFLESLQAVHGLPVSSRAIGMAQLVVTELVTNAQKYAPGPCLLTLEATGGVVAVTVWDSNTTLPVIMPPDPARIGQHGLEMVTALCQSFEMHRAPVGKRVRATLTLADDPGGAAAGRQML